MTSENSSKPQQVEHTASNAKSASGATPLGDNSGVYIPKPETADESQPDVNLDFGGFVISLGTSCMVHLGKFEDPETGKTNVDLPAAKHVIQILTILKEKTQGNLEPDEAHLLNSLVYDLKLAYVEASK